MPVRSLGAALLSTLLAGCYVYTPLETVTPRPDVEVALALTDVGRVEAGHALGPAVDRVEGRVAQATDTAYVLQVSSVRDIRGVVTKWSGETVTVPHAWVGNAYARRLSRSRTYLLAGAFTAGLAALIASRTLGVAGPSFQGSGGQGGGGNTQ
jgi:hypothetical protein